MRVDRAGFTLVELMAVVILLAILVGIALPRFFNYSTEADLAAQNGMIGALQEAYQMVLMGYAAGVTTGLPPDVDDNGFPDHLGDTAFGEPTLFDELLFEPVPTDDNGWKQYAAFPFPHLGILYMYHYDKDGDNVHDLGSESLIVYNNSTGILSAFPP